MTFANQREIKGLSQGEVAMEIGVCKDYVCMIENNKRTPSLILAKRIADLLETTVDHLFFCSHEEQNLS